MIRFWLIIIVALAEYNATKLLKDKGNNAIDAIQDLTDAIASSYFSEARCIAVVTERPGVFLRTLELPVLYVTHDRNNITFDDLMLSAIDTGCLAFVIQVENINWMVEKFSELFRSPKSMFRANRRYLYLPSVVRNAEEPLDTAMDDVFSSKSMNWMPDLLIAKLITEKRTLDKVNDLKQMGNNSYCRIGTEVCGKVQPQETSDIHFLLEIYTHRFVGETPSEKCLLDVWLLRHGFLYGEDLYRDKLHNLMGKEMKLTSIKYPPFSLMILDTTPPLFDGIEFQIMFAFAEKHNITWKMVFDMENLWGEIWDNGSGSGILGATAEDRVDFAFSAIYLWYKEFFYIDYSASYYRSGLTTVTPKPNLLPVWLIPIQPFNSYMWYAVLVSVIIVTVALYFTSKASHILLGGNIASRYSTLVECAFRAAGLLVLQVPDDERNYATARYVPLRHLVTWLILFCLVISSAYGGGLSSILTLPQFEPPIESAKDLADSGLHWSAFDEVYVFFLKSSTDPVMQTLTENFIVHSERELIELAFDTNLALVVERLQGGHFADVKYIFEEMMQGKRLMREDLAFGHCVFTLRKGSPYKENLNTLIFKVREAGIPLFWEGMTVRKFLSQRRQLSVIHSRAPPEVVQTRLSFSHVQGAFYLLAVGLSLSLITFILETVKFISMEKKKGTEIRSD